MNRKIAYIGFGELGKQISLFIRQTSGNDITEIFFDDDMFANKHPATFPFSSYAETQFAGYEFYVCLGYKHLALKTKILTDLMASGRAVPFFIHPSCVCNPTSVIGAGAIIYPGCVIDQHVKIEEGVLLNNSVTISHNSVIGKSTFIAPGAVVCGNVQIGNECFIGSGTVVSNNILIGDHVITGIGTVVSINIPAGRSAIGNPVKILSEKITLS